MLQLPLLGKLGELHVLQHMTTVNFDGGIDARRHVSKAYAFIVAGCNLADDVLLEAWQSFIYERCQRAKASLEQQRLNLHVDFPDLRSPSL